MTYALLVIGILWMIFGMFCSTKGPSATLVFKVIPFLTGMYTTAYAANVLGWLTIA